MKKQTKRTHTFMFPLMLSAEERASLQRQAAELGQTMTEFIKRKCNLKSKGGSK